MQRQAPFASDPSSFWGGKRHTAPTATEIEYEPHAAILDPLALLHIKQSKQRESNSMHDYDALLAMSPISTAASCSALGRSAALELEKRGDVTAMPTATATSMAT